MPHDTEDWSKIWRKIDFLFQKSQKFGEFWPKHLKVSKICTLIGSCCAKYITFDLKKYKGVIIYDTEESCKIWRKTGLWFGKWHEEFCRFSPEHLKISKMCTLMSCFWPKYKMFELKKYRGVMFDGTEYWCKIWRKTNLCFQKWHEEFGKFSPEHLKVSKLGLWWDPFVQSRKCMSLKFTEELCVMTMKNDAKFEEELTCQFKIDMRNLTNFDPSTQKSQKFAL